MYVEGSDDIFYSLYQTSGSFFTKYNKEKKVQDIISQDKGILFLPEKINLDSIETIIKTFNELISLGVDLKNKFIGINLYASDNYISTEICKKIKELETHVSSVGANLVIVAEDLFEIDEIIEANSKLDAEIKYIQSLKVPTENNRPLNDIEKFLMAYDFCTNFKYQENEEHREYARNITSIMNSTDIVCVGYASLLKEMCNRLGIECYNISSYILDKNTKTELGGHQNNIVVLDGKMYYADACWDCTRPEAKGLKLYNHCLIPIEDKDNFIDTDVVYSEHSCVLGYKDENLNKAKNYLKALTEEKEDLYREIDLFINKFKTTIDEKTVKPFNFNLYDSKLPFDEYVKLKKKYESKQELELIIAYLKKYEYGAISYEAFEQSLMNTYLAKGMSVNSAQNLLNRTMALNEKRAQKTFNKKSTNCFYVGSTNELEI